LQNRQLDLEKLLRCLLIIGSLSALVSIVVFYRDQPLIHRLEGVGVARAPTLVGQVYGVVVLIAILLSWRTDRFKHAVLLSLASLPALAALGLSQSRGPLLSLLLALLIGLLWLRPAWKIVLSHSLTAIVILFVLTLQWLNKERALDARPDLAVYRSMSSEPLSFLWGIGMSASTKIVATAVGEVHHAHNAWVDIVYRSGVIGLGSALFHLLWLLWAVRRQRQLAPLALWLIYGCGCLLVDARSLFWEIDAKWLMYWIPAGLLAATLCSRKPMPENSAGIRA
jgi:O-antigen ligase